MAFILLPDAPRYECMREGAKLFPDLDPSAFEVVLCLMRLGDDLMGLFEDYWKRNQISQGRFCVLILLWSYTHGGCDAATGKERVLRTPADLAKAAGVTRATMTGLVDTLERDGYVKRKPDPKDRRMMSVMLTPKAEAFLHKTLPGNFRLMAHLTQTLSKPERKVLVNLLRKVMARAELVRLPDTAMGVNLSRQ